MSYADGLIKMALFAICWGLAAGLISFIVTRFFGLQRYSVYDLSISIIVGLGLVMLINAAIQFGIRTSRGGKDGER
jgi:hypothetical protein